MPDDEIAKYSEVIRRPLDLSSIRRRLEGKLGPPCNPVELQRDLLLMIHNGMVYHGEDSPVWQMALELRTHVMRQLELYATCQGCCQKDFRQLHTNTMGAGDVTNGYVRPP